MLDIPLTKSELTSQSVEQQLSLLTIVTFVLTVYTLILGFASFTRVTINSRPKCYIQETRKTEIDNMLFVIACHYSRNKRIKDLQLPC